MKLKICQLALDGIKLIRSERIFDARGYFAETYVRQDFIEAGIDIEFIQENQSSSLAAGTVRGLHFQLSPFAQTKLIRVLSGRIIDVVVDVRRASPTYAEHLAIELDEAVGEQLLVPVGFAHGFCTLEPNTVVFYKVDKVYSAASERGIHWTDPRLAIDWPIAASEALVSDKDRGLPPFSELQAYF